MRSNTFWTLTCLAVMLATVLLSGWLPAAPTKPKTVIPKILAPKVITTRNKPKPIIKIGGACYILVKIGKPYIYELRGNAKK